MARLKDVAVGVKDLFMMDPRILETKAGWNVREIDAKYEEGILELMTSIRKEGVKESLTIYEENGHYFISNGHRRHDATMRLIKLGEDIKSVPCRTEDKYASEGDRIISMLIRNSGVPLTPMEQANVYKRLLAFGWELPEIAEKVGKSQTYVDGLLKLTAAPAEIVAMVKAGEVSASTAVKTIRQEGSAQACETLKEAKLQLAACGSGKTKVTPKHLKKASTDWAKAGPSLKDRILALRSAQDLTNAVDDLIEFAEGF